MAYVPLNRLKTDLYTSGQEYARIDTQQEYIGYYYELYNGSKFSGKTPNDKTSIRLIEYSKLDYTTEEGDQVVSPVLPVGDFDADPSFPLNVNPQTVKIYRAAIGENPKSSYKRKLPEPHTPEPTQDDYEASEFTRYFAKKINELYFVEINRSTFEKLIKQTNEYYWEPFRTVRMPWRISGDKNQVAEINKNMTLLTEQRFKVEGLQQFLKYDYLKFYKTS